MLGNLKKKLNIAIQEGILISENLSQQYLRASSSNSPTFENGSGNSSGCEEVFLNITELGVPPEINLTAGCALLSKYEEEWKGIRDANEENGQKAAEIAEKIEQIQKKTTAHDVTMTDLIKSLSAIPTLVEKLNSSMETLSDVEKLCVGAEKKIVELQNICEEWELQEEMLEKQFELSQYKQKKMAELEVFRRKLAAEHASKIQLHEEKLRKIQKERQAVFEDAFRSDLEEFKKKGSLQKLEHKEVTSSSELSLEEVDLDNTDTRDALEEFLNG